MPGLFLKNGGWIDIPNMTVPIEVKRGAATFVANGVQKVIPLGAKYPK